MCILVVIVFWWFDWWSPFFFRGLLIVHLEPETPVSQLKSNFHSETGSGGSEWFYCELLKKCSIGAPPVTRHVFHFAFAFDFCLLCPNQLSSWCVFVLNFFGNSCCALDYWLFSSIFFHLVAPSPFILQWIPPHSYGLKVTSKSRRNWLLLQMRIFFFCLLNFNI